MPVTKILDFGQHPYADTFIAEDQVHLSEPVFPLQVNLCAESGMIQLGYISNAEERYNLYAYSYTSSNSKTSRNHWDELAQWVKDKYGSDKLVVEIGSNDGYLVGQFSNAIGVDSSKEMCDISVAKGVNTINDLFDHRVADDILAEHGPAHVVLANNVFNHANDPVKFAISVARVLGNDGVFIFEVPYWGWMVTNGKFPDMVYHEHPTYFTIKGAQTLLERAGLTITDFELVDYHGQSLRITACKGQARSEKVTQAVKQETKQGLFDPVFYQLLQRQLEQQRNAWLADFYELKHNNPDAVIIGVGAAAKANTWLTWHGLNKTQLHCITDSSEFKQGKYTPLSRIPINSDDEFAKFDNPYALVLSWNIGEPLKQALLKINPNTRFISQ
jgi:SAM-dependent methyltransferase